MSKKAPVLDLMAKLRAFEAAHPVRFGPSCSCCLLPEPLRAFISQARREGSTYRHIAAIVEAEGHRTSAATVGRHLREHGKG